MASKGPTHFVYALVDPRTSVPFYVGQTKNGMKRPRQHGRSDKANARKCAIIEAVDFQYEIVVLEVLDPSSALEQEPLDQRRCPWDIRRHSHLDAAETWWICFFGRVDYGNGSLVNESDGGEHPPNGEWWRAANLEAQRKSWEDGNRRSDHVTMMAEMHRNPEYKAKMAAHYASAEWREVLQNKPPEWLANIRKAMQNKTPEWLANIGKAQRNRNPEWIANNRRALQNMSPERIANIGVAAKRRSEGEDWQRSIAARTRDPEWRKRTAEANKKKAADPAWQEANSLACRIKNRRRLGCVHADPAMCNCPTRKANVTMLLQLQRLLGVPH